jgi:hypothetical protein
MGIRVPILMHNVFTQHQKCGHPIHLVERSTFGFDYAGPGTERLDVDLSPMPLFPGLVTKNCLEIAAEFKQDAAIVFCAKRPRPDEDEFTNLIDN